MVMSLELVQALPVRSRVAWAAFVVESVHRHYSESFRRRYLQDDAVRFAWGFVRTGQINDGVALQALCENMKKIVDDVFSGAAGEGYGMPEVSAGEALLGELKRHDGKSAYAAVDHAASAFAVLRLYKLGYHPNDPNFTPEDVDALDTPERAFLHAAYQVALHAESVITGPEIFGSLRLALPPVRALAVGAPTPAFAPPGPER